MSVPGRQNSKRTARKPPRPKVPSGSLAPPTVERSRPPAVKTPAISRPRVLQIRRDQGTLAMRPLRQDRGEPPADVQPVQQIGQLDLSTSQWVRVQPVAAPGSIPKDPLIPRPLIALLLGMTTLWGLACGAMLAVVLYRMLA